MPQAFTHTLFYPVAFVCCSHTPCYRSLRYVHSTTRGSCIEPRPMFAPQMTAPHTHTGTGIGHAIRVRHCVVIGRYDATTFGWSRREAVVVVGGGCCQMWMWCAMCSLSYSLTFSPALRDAGNSYHRARFSSSSSTPLPTHTHLPPPLSLRSFFLLPTRWSCLIGCSMVATLCLAWLCSLAVLPCSLLPLSWSRSVYCDRVYPMIRYDGP